MLLSNQFCCYFRGLISPWKITLDLNFKIVRLQQRRCWCARMCVCGCDRLVVHSPCMLLFIQSKWEQKMSDKKKQSAATATATPFCPFCLSESDAWKRLCKSISNSSWQNDECNNGDYLAVLDFQFCYPVFDDDSLFFLFLLLSSRPFTRLLSDALLRCRAFVCDNVQFELFSITSTSTYSNIFVLWLVFAISFACCLFFF